MELKITWLGHSTWWIEFMEYRLLIDPFLDDNPAATMKAADVTPTHIFVSHGHFDHIADASAIAIRTDAMVFSNFEIASWLQSKHGVKHALGMNLGGNARTPFGSVQLIQAIHSSGLPDGSYGGTAGGFLFRFVHENTSHNLYYTGDTALFSDMKLVAKHRVDTLILPIGDLFTMGPEDSIDAIQWIGPKHVLPCHFNTWPPIAQDSQAWAAKVRESTSANPITLAVGKSFSIGL
jgi:L-ascorbate metabolism protein UlaG (beta-lactamase superfamily)